MFDWIFYIGGKLKQSIITIQTAIAYIDQLIIKLNDLESRNQYEFDFDKVDSEKHLWGIATLYIASKYIEVENNSIRLNSLLKTSKRAWYPK